MLAGEAKSGSDEEFELFRKGVEAGKAALGKAFDEYVGEFWGFLETRPYMRARCGLALALWERGFHDEAIDHIRDMLRLNPNDNQGMRYLLALYLVEIGRDDDVVALLDQYPDDGDCHWSWTKALVAFRQTGDTMESRELLAKALADNRHVPAYLLGEVPLPKSMPPYVGFGDKREAMVYADKGRAGWENTPGAIDWLRTSRPAPKQTKRARSRRAPMH
jgi:tetratricopeptide (TPR) repeat protein